MSASVVMIPHQRRGSVAVSLQPAHGGDDQRLFGPTASIISRGVESLNSPGGVALLHNVSMFCLGAQRRAATRVEARSCGEYSICHTPLLTDVCDIRAKLDSARCLLNFCESVVVSKSLPNRHPVFYQWRETGTAGENVRPWEFPRPLARQSLATGSARVPSNYPHDPLIGYRWEKSCTEV
ncbi:hypothetical protein Bbelb_294470 [Branchiostoma belcheri]|nr:hypothetical protein Bbelb_294470 [Branchiostoma belcheri]